MINISVLPNIFILNYLNITKKKVQNNQEMNSLFFKKVTNL